MYTYKIDMTEDEFAEAALRRVIDAAGGVIAEDDAYTRVNELYAMHVQACLIKGIINGDIIVGWNEKGEMMVRREEGGS
jgi:hypothetical protein